MGRKNGWEMGRAYAANDSIMAHLLPTSRWRLCRLNDWLRHLAAARTPHDCCGVRATFTARDRRTRDHKQLLTCVPVPACLRHIKLTAPLSVPPVARRERRCNRRRESGITMFAAGTARRHATCGDGVLAGAQHHIV